MEIFDRTCQVPLVLFCNNSEVMNGQTVDSKLQVFMPAELIWGLIPLQPDYEVMEVKACLMGSGIQLAIVTA